METLESANAVAPLLPGYEISRHLGHGSNSDVWLVNRLRDRAQLAVKCPRGEAQAEILGNAAREVTLLSHLKHHHLIRVHEVLKSKDGSGGTLGIVMDYAAGGSLANLVSGRKRLAVGETVTVLTPIAQALDHLHNNGIVHGDVSPGNVLFTAVGMPLLADLGLAERVGDRQQNLDAGTTGFRDPFSPASPQGDSGHKLRPQRDVYSLAAVGWYCLTGVVPEPPEVRPPLSLLVPGVPKSMAAALESGLDPDPQMRPTAKEFGTAIFRSAAPETLDLSGAVHHSVIPELLTRREVHGGPARRATRGHPWLRRLLPLPRVGGQAGTGKSGTSRSALAVRLALIGLGGGLIGVVAWTVWPVSGLEPSGPPAEPTVSGPAVPGPTMEPVKADDLPEGLAATLTAEDPAIAAAALSAVRDFALREGRLELLDLVNAQGSPAAEADRGLREQLRQSGTMFAGFTTELSGVAVGPSLAADLIQVDVTATTSAYEERAASGAVVRTQSAGTSQALRLTLIRGNGRWWLSEITGPGN
ncbi:serine/threonine protein kinase [Paenarthrobacter histidinolovorans]|uniref:non-specific serine/threonine protein kinase n=1 Tax=Paenarthrobacter histidinolovorans TaxID=43664 RepID=A0ABW8N7P6_9MICC